MVFRATLTAAAIATAALAMADYWYTVCRYPDNTWQICNFHGDAQCHSASPSMNCATSTRGPR
jgi:hypothetical protein